MAYILTTLVAGAFGLAVYHLYTRRVQKAYARRQGCELPPKRRTRDPVLGLGYKMQDTSSATQGTVLPIGEDLHRQCGLTYRESSIFGMTLKTASVDNIHTTFGLNAEEWGVKPFRYEGMRPFCGDGLLSTDGRTWEHSRALLKPSFHKSNISDLAVFERSVHQLLEQIPKDGSTVDMEPFFSTLVSPHPMSSIPCSLTLSTRVSILPPDLYSANRSDYSRMKNRKAYLSVGRRFLRLFSFRCKVVVLGYSLALSECRYQDPLPPSNGESFIVILTFMLTKL